MGFFSKLFSKSQPKDISPFLSEYYDSCSNVSDQTPIADLRFVVFDTETTSLEKDARLLSIGAVVCSYNQINIDSALDCYVSWGESEEKPENVEIHGITQRQIRTGIEPEDAIRQFIDLIKGSVLVAQHVDFDVAVVNGILKKYFNEAQLKNPVLDTAHLAIRLEKSRFERNNIDRKQYTLDALMNRYQIQPLERHSAIGDAYSTALLLVKLLARLEKRGLKTLGDLRRG